MIGLAITAAVVAAVFWQMARTLPLHRAGTVRSLSRTAAALAGVLLLGSCVAVVPAGHVGVSDFFGHVSDRTLKPGINLRNPLARIIKFSAKTQEAKESMDVPSREGLSIRLDVSVLYHLDPDKSAEIYKTVGSNYAEIILEPNFRSIVRGVTAAHDAQALYTSNREFLANEIRQQLNDVVGVRGIRVESTPMRQITLPARLLESIEQKLQAEQESQRMQFILQKEEQEAKRKEIEAQGIARFQEIVSRDISLNYLKWKGIEATMKLAESPNSKIVVIGAGESGLPLILNQ
jgi:regulator of protease activity HflC (stomatin/prohibitin superfamily)